MLAQVGAVCLLPSEGAADGAVWLSYHLLRCLPLWAGTAAKHRIPAEGRVPDSWMQQRGWNAAPSAAASVVISLLGWGAFLWAQILYVSLLWIARFVCRLLFPASSWGAGCWASLQALHVARGGSASRGTGCSKHCGMACTSMLTLPKDSLGGKPEIWVI